VKVHSAQKCNSAVQKIRAGGTLRTLLYTLCVLVGAAMGQNSTDQFTSGTSGTTTFRTIIASDRTPPTKKCAFDLKPEWVTKTYGKRKPPTPKEEFEATTNIDVYLSNAVYRDTRTASCPYERAVELFGEDRVTFEEGVEVWDSGEWKVVKDNGFGFHMCPVGKQCRLRPRRVLVDGEVVYEEKP
jgi:hypothetical protein